MVGKKYYIQKIEMSKNKITAVLGPTNTGKTHLAIETMLSFESGMIGFPLRLLAREVYDKVVLKTGQEKVALINRKEKIIPTEIIIRTTTHCLFLKGSIIF